MVENLPRGSRYRSVDSRVRLVADQVFAIKESGEPINSNSLRINHPALFQRIYNLPGGWARAVREAGFDPDEEKVRKNKS